MIQIRPAPRGTHLWHSGDPERSTRRAGRGRTWPTRDRAPRQGVTRCIPMRSKAPTGAGMRSCRQTLGRGRSCRGSQWRCQTIAAPMSGRPIPRPHTPHRSGVAVEDAKPIPAPMFNVKPSASADGSSSPGPTPACRIVVGRHGGFVRAVTSLYKDEGAERLQSPNAATGKPLKKKTCTAAGTLLEVPLTPRVSRVAPPQPICGHLSSRRLRCNVRFGRSEGSLRQARGRAAASG